MNLPALARFAESCEEKRLSSVLLSNPATITWLTGYAPPIQTGPNPFEGGPALGWWDEGKLTLVLSDGEAGAAGALGLGTRDYVAYTIEGPAAGFRHQVAALKELIAASGDGKGRVGLEFNFLPAALLETIREALPHAELIPLDASFDLLRAVKTPDEVQRIRASLALCDLAQAETIRLMRRGMSEIDLWTQVKAALEVAAGGRLPVLADFVAGGRSADVGGLPGGYVLQDGDAVIADIVPRLNGYWGDNCGTHFVGEPPVELRKAYQVVREALCAAISVVKPGLRACDLDGQLRRAGGRTAAARHHAAISCRVVGVRTDNAKRRGGAPPIMSDVAEVDTVLLPLVGERPVPGCRYAEGGPSNGVNDPIGRLPGNGHRRSQRQGRWARGCGAAAPRHHAIIIHRIRAADGAAEGAASQLGQASLLPELLLLRLFAALVGLAAMGKADRLDGLERREHASFGHRPGSRVAGRVPTARHERRRYPHLQPHRSMVS